MKQKQMFSWNSFAFSTIQKKLASSCLVLLPLWNLAFTSGNSRFTYYWKLTWRILSITLLSCKVNESRWLSQQFLALPFFEIGMKIDVFQSCGNYWVFQFCWHFECNTLTASSFGILNSPTGILLPPLALFVVMFPKAHLTSYLNTWL